MLSRKFSACLLLVLALACAGLGGLRAGEEWRATLGPYAPGNFPELRPARAHYNFGWNGVTAATAELRFSRTAEGLLQLEATGRTEGLARKLWKFEVEHRSTAEPRTLRPIQVREVERARNKRLTTEITFTPQGATSRRLEEKNGQSKDKTRSFTLPDTMSLSSALLYLRSKPLAQGAVERVVVYPQTTGYLCTVTVLGREQITVPLGTFPAIKVDVQLQKINDQHVLQPHKKFKQATAWLSDDNDRLILRAESQIFLGTVFLELQSVQFEGGVAKP